ncbi:hypothetical protein IKS57_06350, partial [bacterium]|nr:hypothetical protein [bacterium]
CSFIAISTTTTIVTPIEINAANAISNNNPTISTSSIIHSVKTQNIQNNGNSILSDVSERKIDNMISNFYTDNPSKNISMFMKQTTNSDQDQIVINKAKMIVNKLYTNQISLSSLRKNIQNRYNDLTAKQKEYIQNKIQQNQTDLNKGFNTKQLMFCYPSLFILQNDSNFNVLTNINSLIQNVIQNIQGILNKITGIKVFASLLTVLAIAATAIAAAD